MLVAILIITIVNLIGIVLGLVLRIRKIEEKYQEIKKDPYEKYRNQDGLLGRKRGI
jgi:uncharacterized membrane protein